MKKLFFFSAALILLLIICISSCKKTEDTVPSQQPKKKNLIKVPLTRQATDYTCGASAFQSILYYYGVEYMESDIATLVHSDTTNGTPYLNIKSVAESLNFSVEIKKNSTFDNLKTYLDEGKPVLVLIQAWTEQQNVDWKNDWIDGHYVVAIGYDSNNVYFMDPSTLGNYTFIPQSEFFDRWHDVDGQNDTCRNFIMSIQQTSGSTYIPETILKID